jgi:hypothetical protein
LLDRSRQLAQLAEAVSLNSNATFSELFTERMLFEPF